jgi:3-hydroxyacyl-CoA dehydrogenase/enoyl-CoA hydratase/3-hydroxybutyryl-CoA epimerase
MTDGFGRTGRAGGAGFYEYDQAGNRLRIWPGLRDAFGAGGTDMPFGDLQERLLFAEALEAVRCIDEGVVTSVADANIGSLLGCGFPRWTGGVIQYISSYQGGPAGFAARARELADRYGERFAGPQSLTDIAVSGHTLDRLGGIRLGRGGSWCAAGPGMFSFRTQCRKVGVAHEYRRVRQAGPGHGGRAQAEVW